MFAPSNTNSYAGSSFPGIVDLIYEIENDPKVDPKAKWEEVKKHLAAVVFAIHSAAGTFIPPEYLDR